MEKKKQLYKKLEKGQKLFITIYTSISNIINQAYERFRK
jgi:hypothetical protein